METILIAFITALIGPVAVEWAKTKLSKKKDLVAETINSNEVIDHQLDILMGELNCDRIWISQFHNGGHFYPTGKSIKKFSIFYEKTASNVPSIKDTFQNVPVSLFSKSLSKIYKESEVVIEDCSNVDRFCEFTPFINEETTKSLLMISIDDMEGNLIGILAIEYIKQHHILELNQWITLRQKIGVIGSLLDNYLKSKK